MLFHITHTHKPEGCLYRDPDTLAATFGTVGDSMQKAGVDVVGFWVDATAHTFFWVVDSPSAEALTAGLDPIVERGHAAIRPITDANATIAARKAATR